MATTKNLPVWPPAHSFTSYCWAFDWFFISAAVLSILLDTLLLYHLEETLTGIHFSLSFLKSSWYFFHSSELLSQRFKTGRKNTHQNKTQTTCLELFFRIKKWMTWTPGVPSALPHWNPYWNKALETNPLSSLLEVFLAACVSSDCNLPFLWSSNTLYNQICTALSSFSLSINPLLWLFPAQLYRACIPS